MLWSDFMSPDQAERIAKLQSSDIAAILYISTLSQRAEDILQIARQIRDGVTPAVPENVLSATPKPLCILASSFVKDKNQYNTLYGISDEKARHLESLLLLEPEETCEEIRTIVAEKLEAKGSQRKVEVILQAVPSSNQTLAGNIGLAGDGGAKELSAEIAKNSTIYGHYQFEPEATGLTGQHQYKVHLGDDLFIFGQSKKVVISAARICRVKGRHAEVVKPYIWYWTAGSNALHGDEIPENVWDGKQKAHQQIKPRKTEAELSQKRKRSVGESELVAEDVD